MMRRAEPNELTTAAVPVLTARISEAELAKWVPVPFDLILDPQQTPEPSLGALVALDSGGYVVLYYGKTSGQLTVEIPEAADPSTAIDAFFEEIPLSPDRVLWHRPDVQVPNVWAQPKKKRERGASVLIVDDDPTISRLLLIALRKHEISADCVRSAPDVIQRLARYVYDVMILDASLDASFLPAELRRVMHYLRNMSPDERPVVFAVYSGTRAVENLDVDLISGFVRKPFDIEVLQDLIATSIEQRRQISTHIASTPTPMRRNR